MANYFTDNPDLLYQFSQVDWKQLVELTEAPYQNEESYASADEAKQFFYDILSQMGEFIANEIAPHNQELDEQHPEIMEDGEVKEPERMGSIMKKLAELGAMGLSLPRRLGGMNAPMIVNSILLEMIARADVAVMSHFGFHGGIGFALMAYSVEEGSTKVENGNIVETRFDDEISKIAAGQEWGAMVLTEPGAGSDLAKIRAKAELQDDGSWLITGQKIFITSGHGEYHIVIARSEPIETHPGLKGLSLFYSPAHIEKDGKRVRNFEVGGVEHKMGQHSAVAATINFDSSYGELIGKRGHGFLGMLLLMNNARIAVGFESLGIMETAYRKAKAYAEERVSMGKPIGQHEMIADYLDEMEVTMAGLRAITFEAAEYEEMATRMKFMLKSNPPDDKDEFRTQTKAMKKLKRRARHLTPLIKYVGGEECVRYARLSMQIHGGIGYIVEAGIEKLLRDALVIPVYEGTSQIQALMALKDNMQKVIRRPGKYLTEQASIRFEAMTARDSLDKGMKKMRQHVLSAMQSILTQIAGDKLGDLKGIPMMKWKSTFMKDWDPSKDFAYGLLHAEKLCQILSWEAMANALVKQAEDAKGTDDEASRRDLAERFLERFEPRARCALLLIEEKSSVVTRLQNAG